MNRNFILFAFFFTEFTLDLIEILKVEKNLTKNSGTRNDLKKEKFK